MARSGPRRRRHAGLLWAAALAALAALPPLTMAASADAGKMKAARCGTCHGPRGISVTQLVPNLAGQKEAYLVKALEEYRAGRRANSMMRAIAASLSDADMSDIAAYYSHLPPR